MAPGLGLRLVKQAQGLGLAAMDLWEGNRLRLAAPR